jgi:ketosteroid isomerase-like protein
MLTHSDLPKPVAAYIEATNNHDGAALAASFTEDAFVNDMHREFWGRPAIKAWADKEIIGAKVTMEPVRIATHHGQVHVTAKIDGEYDKTGLPDPLILTFYFALSEGRIAQLIILHNKQAA